MRETVYDRWNNAIYLTDERWEHILEFHEEMAAFRAELFTTLSKGKRRQDHFDPSVYLYFYPFDSLPGGNTHIIVVVKFTPPSRTRQETSNNFVLTAYQQTLFSQR